LRRCDASPATVKLRFEKLAAESASLKTENAQLNDEGTQTPALKCEGAGISALTSEMALLKAEFARGMAGPAPVKPVVAASVSVQQCKMALQSPALLAENAQWDEGPRARVGGP
jgi:hypothetical protein